MAFTSFPLMFFLCPRISSRAPHYVLQACLFSSGVWPLSDFPHLGWPWPFWEGLIRRFTAAPQSGCVWCSSQGWTAEVKGHSHPIGSTAHTISMISHHAGSLAYMVQVVFARFPHCSYCSPPHQPHFPYCSLWKHNAKPSLAPFWPLLLGPHFQRYLKKKLHGRGKSQASRERTLLALQQRQTTHGAEQDSAFGGAPRPCSCTLDLALRVYHPYPGSQLCGKRNFPLIKYNNFLLRSG